MLRHDLNTKGRDGRLAPWRRGRFTRSNELNSVSCREQRHRPRKESIGVQRSPNHVERQRECVPVSGPK